MELIRRPQTIKAKAHKDDVVIAIGDVHGQFDLLEKALEAAQKTIPKKSNKVELVLLGDLIDRGKKANDVVDLARNGYKDWRMHCLMGNHEQVLLKLVEGKKENYASDFALWLNNGGQDTLECMKINLPSLSKISVTEHRKILGEGIGKKRLSFFKSLTSHYRSGDVLCVHAGINPKESLKKNFEKETYARDENHWAWIRDGFLDYEKDFPEKVFVVHGHTIIPGPKVKSNRIGLDTGAYRYGVLTGATFFHDKMTIFQVTQD